MDKEVKNLISRLEAQGWRCEQSTKGWKCFPPDKRFQMVAIHKTPSDRNWLAVCIRLLRKNGFTG